MSVFIIAEAGVNHNGSLEQAKKLIEAAARSGANAVKFQTFKAKELASTKAELVEYQKNSITAPRNDKHTINQFEMLQSLELPHATFKTLRAYAAKHQILFLSTAFDCQSLEFVINSLGIERIKIPSGELNNAPLLVAAGQSGLPILMSTGMSDMYEIERALKYIVYGKLYDKPPKNVSSFDIDLNREGLYEVLLDTVTLLQCTSEYPTPVKNLNLNNIKSISERFRLPVGLSDHSIGIEAPIAAVAMGAVVIEKHFTLSHDLEGPDHLASLLPEDLGDMVKNIRRTEKALGSSIKKPTKSENKTKLQVRKGLYARCKISKGEKIGDQHIAILRPVNSVPPEMYWDVIGQHSPIDIGPGESLDQLYKHQSIKKGS